MILMLQYSQDWLTGCFAAQHVRRHHHVDGSMIVWGRGTNAVYLWNFLLKVYLITGLHICYVSHKR